MTSTTFMCYSAMIRHCRLPSFGTSWQSSTYRAMTTGIMCVKDPTDWVPGLPLSICMVSIQNLCGCFFMWIIVLEGKLSPLNHPQKNLKQTKRKFCLLFFSKYINKSLSTMVIFMFAETSECQGAWCPQESGVIGGATLLKANLLCVITFLITFAWTW